MTFSRFTRSRSARNMPSTTITSGVAACSLNWSAARSTSAVSRGGIAPAAWNSRGRAREARELRLEALALSRRLGDPVALARSARFVLFQGPPQYWDERLHLARESVGWPREGVSSQALGSLLWYSARLLLANGDRVRAEELWRQVQELAERT